MLSFFVASSRTSSARVPRHFAVHLRLTPTPSLTPAAATPAPISSSIFSIVRLSPSPKPTASSTAASTQCAPSRCPLPAAAALPLPHRLRLICALLWLILLLPTAGTRTDQSLRGLPTLCASPSPPPASPSAKQCPITLRKFAIFNNSNNNRSR